MLYLKFNGHRDHAVPKIEASILIAPEPTSPRRGACAPGVNKFWCALGLRMWRISCWVFLPIKLGLRLWIRRPGDRRGNLKGNPADADDAGPAVR